MPYKTRAELESERDELRGALASILDRVTNALGDDDDDDDAEDDDEEYDENDE
jgi:hypothetical protein